MADFNNPFPDSGAKFWTVMAGIAGSMLSLRTLVDASPWMRMLSACSSFTLAFFTTPFIARVVGAGEDGERLIALIGAFLGVNILAGVAVFGVKWREDPAAAMAWLFSILTAWRGVPK